MHIECALLGKAQNTREKIKREIWFTYLDGRIPGKLYSASWQEESSLILFTYALVRGDKTGDSLGRRDSRKDVHRDKVRPGRLLAVVQANYRLGLFRETNCFTR